MKTCCDKGEECAKALKIVECHKKKNKALRAPVSNSLYKALHTLKDREEAKRLEQHRAEVWPQCVGPTIGPLPLLPPRRMRRDDFSCDKEAYELFVAAEEEGRPLGHWVTRMLDDGVLYTDVNYLERPGWQHWPFAHFCDNGGDWVFGRIGIANKDAQERLFPSLVSYVRANQEVTHYSTVFVTGNREFYEEVLLDEDRMGLLVETFLERTRIICKPRNLIRRVWFVSKDQKVLNNATDEVCIRVPKYPEISEALRRKPDKSDFLPNELSDL